VRRLLGQMDLLAPAGGGAPEIELYATGGLNSLKAAAQRWLGVAPQRCEAVEIG